MLRVLMFARLCEAAITDLMVNKSSGDVTCWCTCHVYIAPMHSWSFHFTSPNHLHAPLDSVGYAMHHSKSRAPFLRRVVSNEVSGDPETWSDAFLGMSNAAYCTWINEPTNWGGGIELAILAAHYRREIAAWNIESGEAHVFGEEAGGLWSCGVHECGGLGSETALAVSWQFMTDMSLWRQDAGGCRNGVSLC
jgi:hypothetical protein